MGNPFVKVGITKENWNLILNEFNKNNDKVDGFEQTLNEQSGKLNDFEQSLNEQSQSVTGLSDQLAESAINVKSKGATLDGLTDCTQYLVAAHDALPSTGGKIFVPAGIMKVTSPVTFTKTVILEGASVAHLTGTTGSVILMDGSGELIFKGSSSGVRDILVDGVAGNTGNGITMLNNRPWLDNVTTVNQGGHGVQIGHDTDTTINVNSGYVANLRTKGNKGDGLKIVHADATSPNANTITIVALDAGYNVGNGLTMKNCFDNTIVGAHNEGNSGYGIQLINSGSHVFLKPYCEFNTLGPLKADSNSKYNYVYGHRRDANITGFIFDSVENFIQGRSTSKGLFPFSNKQAIDEFILSVEGISGYVKFKQNATNRDIDVTMNGTSSLADLNISGLGAGRGVKVKSPNGTQYRIYVDDTGTVKAVLA